MYPIEKWDPKSVKSQSINSQNLEHPQRMPDSISKVVSSSNNMFCQSIMKVPEDLPFPEDYKSSKNQLQQSVNSGLTNMQQSTMQQSNQLNFRQNSISSNSENFRNSQQGYSNSYMSNCEAKFDSSFQNQYPSQKLIKSEQQRINITSSLENYHKQSQINSANTQSRVSTTRINNLPEAPNAGYASYKNNPQMYSNNINLQRGNTMVSNNAFQSPNQSMSNNNYNSNSPSVKMQMPNQVNREPTLNNHHNSLTNSSVCYNNLGNRSVPFTSFEVPSQFSQSYQNQNLTNNFKQQMSTSMNNFNPKQNYMSPLNKIYKENDMERSRSFNSQVPSGGSCIRSNNVNLTSTPISKQQYPVYQNNKSLEFNKSNNFLSTQARQSNNIVNSCNYNNSMISQNNSQTYSGQQYVAKPNLSLSYPASIPNENPAIFHNPLVDGNHNAGYKSNSTTMNVQNPKNVKQSAGSKLALTQLRSDLNKACEPFESPESFEKFKNMSLGIKGKTMIVPLSSNAKEFKPNEMKTVKDLISEFISSEAVWTNLDFGLKNLTKELNKKVIDEDTVKDVSKLVYDASMKRSFSYFGAKICDYFSKPDVGLVNYRKELLTLAQKDFGNLDNLLKFPESSNEKNRAIAFSYFLVELYLNLKVDNCGAPQNISILGKKFVSTAEKLIENKSDSTIECAVMILKLGMSTILEQLGPSEEDEKYVTAIKNLVKNIGLLKETFPEMSNKCALIVSSFMKSRASVLTEKDSSCEHPMGEKLPLKDNGSNTKVTDKQNFADETVYYNKDGTCYTETGLFMIEQEKALNNETDQHSDSVTDDSIPDEYGDYYEDFLNSLDNN